MHDETVDINRPLTIFDPHASWKKKTFDKYVLKEMQVPVFKEGKLIYKQPNLEEIRKRVAYELGTLWEEARRFENPHEHYVDLSFKLWKLKQELINDK